MTVDSRVTSLTDYIRIESPDLLTKTHRFQVFLADLRQRDLEKYLLRYVHMDGGMARVRDASTGAERSVQVYCSADYLDFGKDRRVIDAACAATSEFGV